MPRPFVTFSLFLGLTSLLAAEPVPATIVVHTEGPWGQAVP